MRTYTYYCAQNEAEVKKSELHEDLGKRRARMKMSRFACGGGLQITVNDDDVLLPLRLKLTHRLPHLHYVDISISKNIRELVESLKHESAANVSSNILCRGKTTAH